MTLIKDAFNEIGAGAIEVSVEQLYEALGKIESALKELSPKKILEWIVIVVIEDIKITWTEVKAALAVTLANPVEILVVKKAFDYLSGGKDQTKVGEIVNKIKELFAEL